MSWTDPDRRDAAEWRVVADIVAAPPVPEYELSGVTAGRVRLTGDPTRAELDVLEALSRGLLYSEAAVVLGKSVETVKTQVKHARFLLRAKNTTEACCEAIRRGLIS